MRKTLTCAKKSRYFIRENAIPQLMKHNSSDEGESNTDSTTQHSLSVKQFHQEGKYRKTHL